MFTADRAALGLLVAILVAVFGVAANGIAASSGYWVHQRIRQTWIRRALGATRGQVIAYFMTENAVICGLGMFLASALDWRSTSRWSTICISRACPSNR